MLPSELLHKIIDAEPVEVGEQLAPIFSSKVSSQICSLDLGDALTKRALQLLEEVAVLEAIHIVKFLRSGSASVGPLP